MQHKLQAHWQEEESQSSLTVTRRDMGKEINIHRSEWRIRFLVKDGRLDQMAGFVFTHLLSILFYPCTSCACIFCTVVYICDKNCIITPGCVGTCRLVCIESCLSFCVFKGNGHMKTHIYLKNTALFSCITTSFVSCVFAGHEHLNSFSIVLVSLAVMFNKGSLQIWLLQNTVLLIKCILIMDWQQIFSKYSLG